MKYQGTLIAVSDMAKSKHFYETVMEQKVIFDTGDNNGDGIINVAFENGLSLQAGYEKLVGVKLDSKSRSNNFQLYFEVEDLNYWQKKIKAEKGIEIIHEAKEYPWGQRVMRFYDFDKFIVEVSESMETVVKRFLEQGKSVEETAKLTMFPIEYIKTFI